MATIKAIEGGAVHQIQSGQVIVDLCSVVKELVENSLDAGATSIDVRFKNQGLDAIEIQDNGHGIPPHNYETIALKHHTSKLSTYSDLLNLKTFGFRGEALSSLCALAQISVITCLSEDFPKGTKLEFETSGKLKEKSTIAAQKGTTISVQSIFGNLPVRRQELVRNIKREWNKMTNILSQYACIQIGVKFSVTQQTERGKKTMIFSTKGNNLSKDNIINIFGAKALSTLVPLEINLKVDSSIGPTDQKILPDNKTTNNVRIVGHVSLPLSGENRQIPDKQMFFVNSRPCHLPQVAKAFNEAFRSYDSLSPPFIFANLELDTHLYDVNVSPDKRTILLHNQGKILEALKLALFELIESRKSLIPASRLQVQKQEIYKQSQISYHSSPISKAVNTPTASIKHVHKQEILSSKEDDQGFEDLHHNSGDSVLASNSSSKGLVDDDDDGNRLSLKYTSQKYQKHKSRHEISIKNLEIHHKNTEQSCFVTQTSGICDEETDAASMNKLKRSNNNDDLSSERIFQEPDSKRCRRSQMTNIYSEDSFLSIDYLGKKNHSVTSRNPSILFRQTRCPEMAKITIGDKTTIDPIGTSYLSRNMSDFSSPLKGRDKNRKRPPNLPSNSPSNFGLNLSNRFSASAFASGTQSQTTSDENDDLSRNDSEVEKSQELSQISPIFSEDSDKSDCETPEAFGVPLPSNATVVSEDMELSTDSRCTEDKNYIDEKKKKAYEEAKVRELIREAEISGVTSPQDRINRSRLLLKGMRKKDSTLNHVQTVEIDMSQIKQEIRLLERIQSSFLSSPSVVRVDEGINSLIAEEKLSLKISKSDFHEMKIIGQFNLGFIIVSRSSDTSKSTYIDSRDHDDLFIIDQHASDEKYNFERLQATTILQSQKLVVPKTLHLTALEEEIIMEHMPILQSNGFIISVDQSGHRPVGNRCELTSLPLSRETTFSLSDLRELLNLLADHPFSSDSTMIPRPSRVQKMLAMRACRSSIMIGKTLTHKQMKKIVSHLGELDKPWNCPHGRPTMRHLCGMDMWDTNVWKGDIANPSGKVWQDYIARNTSNIDSTKGKFYTD
ncbi:putative dna mismatch repair protein [Golovinomyces cichoracearum]|uniref:DNA mismatch repair protein PMS1 n=1 Tax=Golovinomyces cichoracearum TaxID=62708 RepID=A0A420IC85_9PEZI|nr:putative dna mismatch repair protein [Golovinomyces cichoracearum]